MAGKDFLVLLVSSSFNCFLSCIEDFCFMRSVTKCCPQFLGKMESYSELVSCILHLHLIEHIIFFISFSGLGFQIEVLDPLDLFFV